MKRMFWVVILFASISWGATLTWLGSLGTPYAECHGVSADGNTVCGWAGVYEPHYAWRWTNTGGMETIPALIAGRSIEAWGLSADGRVVVGYGMTTGSNYRGFRYDGDSMLVFGTLGGSISWAYAASYDGSKVAGSAEHSSGFNHAFRWTADSGMQDLGVLPGAVRSVARAISLDGGVVVGWSGYGNSIHHAFRWENGEMVSIHNPSFGQSEGLGVSGDGSTAVGAWGPPSMTPTRPFRWTEATGMYDLGTLGGEWGEAWAANYDGTVVVGWSERSQGNWGAFRWTVQGGMEDLNVTYAQLLSPGSVLRDAMAISPDGRYIVGRGYNGATGRDEAYLLDTGPIGVEDGNRSVQVVVSSLPNPFSDQVIIKYQLPARSRVELKVYDLSGRVVLSSANSAQEPGSYEVDFMPDQNRAKVYFLLLRTDFAIYQHRLVRAR